MRRCRCFLFSFLYYVISITQPSQAFLATLADETRATRHLPVKELCGPMAAQAPRRGNAVLVGWIVDRCLVSTQTNSIRNLFLMASGKQIFSAISAMGTKA